MVFMALYAGLQSCVWLVVRVLSEDYSPEMLVFYRNFFGLFVVLPMIWRTRGRAHRTARSGLHFLRGLVACVGVYALFYAVSSVPLATVTAITFGAPLFAAAIAILCLGEGVSTRRLVALAVGFVGMLVVVMPFDGPAPASAKGLAAAFLGTIMIAAAFIVVKLLGRTETPESMVINQFLLLVPVSALVAAPTWQMPGGEALLLLAVMGGGFTLAQAAMARAFALADAVILMPLDFLRLVIAALAGLVFLGEDIALHVWAGALVIMLGAAVSAFDARQVSRVS